MRALKTFAGKAEGSIPSPLVRSAVLVMPKASSGDLEQTALTSCQATRLQPFYLNPAWNTAVRPPSVGVPFSRSGISAEKHLKDFRHVVHSFMRDNGAKVELVYRKEILLERGGAIWWWSALRQFRRTPLDLNGTCWARVEQNARAWRAEAVKQIRIVSGEPNR
jgi:hypothetical protein